ncbi:hypothetical protein PWT90_03982 [Aphanocladium album]|nr:hypothetical protein PWT90_03982 [Aphanocladium album]
MSAPTPSDLRHERDGAEKTIESSASMQLDLEPALEDTGAQHKSTTSDMENMRRMGRDQELVRHFRLWSMISFVALATAAWELAIFGISPALIDGGHPSLIYSSVWCFVGFGPIYLSMSEMASMAPIAGAQYHWVSEFAPERAQKILSYFTGWSSTLAWQAGNAWGLILIGTLLQAIIMVNSEAYAESAPNWHGTIIVIVISILAVAANVFGAKWLPYWQNAAFALHIIAYAGFIIPIWVNAPKASHFQVWGDWQDRGGWPSIGLSVLVGQLPALSSQTAIDSAVHMAEETRDASVSIPRVMMITWVFNYVTIFIALITIAYHMPDIDLAVADSTGYPVIYVLKESMPLAWLNVVLIVILLLLIFGNLSYLASVTRDLFAFARDQGLPFSPWISQVDAKRSIPTNACIVTGTTTALLSLIYIGSPVAFYAVISLSTVAILQCYCFSIGCLLWRRIAYPETLPPAKFSLGIWGIPTNIAAVLFSFYSFFWCFWPQENHVNAGGFNWASPLFVVTGIVAFAYYFLGGRKKYHGPVVHIEGRKSLPNELLNAILNELGPGAALHLSCTCQRLRQLLVPRVFRTITVPDKTNQAESVLAVVKAHGIHVQRIVFVGTAKFDDVKTSPALPVAAQKLLSGHGMPNLRSVSIKLELNFMQGGKWVEVDEFGIYSGNCIFNHTEDEDEVRVAEAKYQWRTPKLSDLWTEETTSRSAVAVRAKLHYKGETYQNEGFARNNNI